jgi:hypothetical protein
VDWIVTDEQLPADLPDQSSSGDLERVPQWNEAQVFYDSGVYQGQTAFLKPLYDYRMGWRNMPISKVGSLELFFNRHKKITPFFIKDPYQNRVNSVLLINTGGVSTNTWYARNTESWTVFPDSAYLTIISALSGTLVYSTHYHLDHDTGILTTVLTPTGSDYWRISSMEYFKKVVFKEFSNVSPRWEMFDVQLSIKEIV